MSYNNDEEEKTDNDPGMLLNLSQKSNIFVADQTPTPTRLIKNCEEVGLFEDLRNVNPFDETFRRACEQNVQHTPRSHQNFHTDEESLHTPQVFPQFDAAVEGGICAGEDLTKQTLDTPVVLDVSQVDNILDVSAAPPAKPKSAEITSSIPKYRAIAEKPAMMPTNNGITFLPTTVQFVQPQLITVSFASSPTIETLNGTSAVSLTSTIQQKILPKSKPLLLPKLATCTNTTTKETLTTSTPPSSSALTSSPTPHPEPSSASMTPTSQLPIKERLKAILNQSSKSRPPEWPDKTLTNSKSCTKSHSHKATSSSSSLSLSYKTNKDDTMERRRAASTRYRHKMRNEHKDLKKRNMELQTDNDRLRQRVKQLEAEVAKLQSSALQPVLAPSTNPAFGVPAQLQIPASTIHLVMNIPKLVVPCGNDVNTQAILKNPISYRIDKN